MRIFSQFKFKKMDINEWINRAIKGPTGFETLDDRECVIFHKSREEGIAEFVIRCLANPLCEGSKEVLEAIYEQRKADNKADAGIKTEWDIRKCFEGLRLKENHLGLGDIRLTIGMQEEICELVERFYIRR